MESPSKSSTHSPPQQGTPRSVPLESMSQEDLVKNCKKQRILMQKLKAKCDDLQGQLKKCSDYDEIKQNHAKLLETNEELQRAKDQLAAEKTSAEKAKSSLSEEFECLQMKQETLVSSLQCLQEDFAKATTENKQLQADAELTQKRVVALKHKFKDMQVERQDLNDQLTDKEHQIVALKDHIKKLSENENKMSERCKVLESENEANKSELSAVKISLQFFEQQNKTNSADSSEMVDQLKSNIEDLKSELAAVLSNKDELKLHVQELRNAKSNADDNVQRLEGLLSSAQEDLKQKCDELDQIISTVEQSKEEHSNLVKEVSEKLSTASCERDDSFSKLEKAISEKDDLENMLKGLQQNLATLQSEADALTKQKHELESILALKTANEDKQLENSKESMDDLNMQIETLTRQNLELEESYQKTVVNLSEASVAIKGDLNKEKESLEAATQRENELSSNLQAANETIETLKRDLEISSNEHATKEKEFEENVHILESEKSQLSLELKDKLLILESIEIEKQKLQAHISEQNEKETSLLANIQRLESDQSSDKDLSDKYHALVKLDDEHTKVIDELQKVVEQTKKDLQESRTLIEKQTSASDLKISELMRQNDEVNTQLNESAAKCKHFQKEILHLKENVNTIEQAKFTEIENLTSANKILEEQNASVKMQLDSLTESMNQNCSEQQSALLAVQQKLSASEQEKLHQKDVITDLQIKVDDQEKSILAHKAADEKKKTELEVLEKELEEAKSLLCESQAKMEQLAAKQSELKQKCADLEEEKQGALGGVENACKEKEALLTELDKVRIELRELHLQQNTLQQSENDSLQLLNELKSKLSESEGNAKELQIALTEAKSQLQIEIQKQQQLAEDLETAAIEHKATVENMQSEHDSEVANLEKQCSELARQLSCMESVEASVTEMKKNHSLLIEENQQLMDNVAVLQNELKSLNSKQDEETAKFNEIKEAHVEATSELEEKLKMSQSENEQLKAQVQAITVECDALKVKVGALENVERETLQQSSTSQSEKIEALEHSIKEKDVYNAKLKALTMKARKELDASKQQLQKALEEKTKLQTQLASLDSQLQGSQAHASNVQMMQIECDKLQDQVDLIKEEKQAMQKNIEGLFVQLAAEKDEKQNLQTKLDTAKTDFEKLKKDKQDVEVLLASTKSTVNSMEKEKESITKEKNTAKQELDAVRIQLTSLKKAVEEKDNKLQETEGALNDAKKNLKQHDLMSLEMAEYDKTINDLQTQSNELETTVEEKSEEIERLEQKIADLQEENKTIENLRVDAEDRVTKNKESLDKCREEISDLASAETELKGQLEVITSQLELQQQQNEQFKLELSGKTAEQRELQEKIDSLRSSSTRTIDLLERKVNSMQMELNSQRLEYDTLSSDYESYKVRVHSVLKQQKSKDSQPPVQPDKTEILQLRQKTSQLQAKLIETQNILTSREGELDLLQGDYDRLLRQQQQSSDSAVEREGRWKTRVKSLQQELTTLRKQHTDLTQKMTQQNDMASESVAKELAKMREEHDRERDVLKGEIEAKDNELCALRNEVRSLQEEKHVSSTPRKPSAQHFRMPSVDHSHHVMAAALDYRSVAREDGEGEENPDATSIVSFEQVLQASNIKSVTEVSETASMTSEMHVKQLETKLEAQSRQLEHISEVARENEAMSARLSDQNRVLKDEIRRLEKNQEREQSVANLEYLKNVVYKFVTLPPSDERRHLLPVIDTMLKLSPEERNTLQAIATDEDAPNEGQGSGGWGSYLQRWSGMQ